MDEQRIGLRNVREYAEGEVVELVRNEDTQWRWAILALNEAGYNHTMVDLEDIIAWARMHPYIAGEMASGKQEGEA